MSSTQAKTKRARGRIRIEPGAKRVRAYLGGEVVADTTRPMLVWEIPYYPAYYFPAEDVRTDLLEADGGVARSPSRGDGRTFAVRAGGKEASGAATRYEDSPDRGAARPDPASMGRDGRLVRGGRGGVHAPP